MKKRFKQILSGLGLSLFLFSFTMPYGDIDKEVSADGSNLELGSITIDSFSNLLYPQIQFDQDTLSKKVFKMALSGYAKLKNEDALNKDSILAVIDYSLSSTKRRLWVINLNSKKVILNEWVAHGKNSGGEYASKFSNKGESRMTSIGFMVTGEIYDGKHKSSLKLNGFESLYNSNVFSRGVVIHGADYVSSDLAKSDISMGRSYGCPAVRKEINEKLISTINDGVCLFSYYPNSSYLARSKYVNYKGMVQLKHFTTTDSTNKLL